MKTIPPPPALMAAQWHHQESVPEFPALMPGPALRSECQVCQGWDIWKAPQVSLVYSKVKSTGVAQGFLKSDPWTSSVNIPWAFVRNGSSQNPPQSWGSETVGAGPSSCVSIALLVILLPLDRDLGLRLGLLGPKIQEDWLFFFFFPSSFLLCSISFLRQ